jgi:hypothetical protein
MRNAIYLLLLLSISACVRLEANVQSFSNLPTVYAGKKVAVLGYPEKINESLEWRSYKPVFEKEFQQQGFVISNEDSADYIAYVTYGIGGPTTTTQIGSTPTYGQTGGGTTYSSGTVSSYGGGFGSYSGSSYTMPTYGVVGSSTYSYDVTTYTRTVAIDLVEKTNNNKVYEGKATSTGSCGVMAEVIDEIAEAIFKEFPVGSGKVSIQSKANC